MKTTKEITKVIIKTFIRLILAMVLILVVFSWRFYSYRSITYDETFYNEVEIIESVTVDRFHYDTSWTCYGLNIRTNNDSYAVRGNYHKDEAIELADKLEKTGGKVALVFYEDEFDKIKKVVDIRNEAEVFLDLSTYNSYRNKMQLLMIIACVAVSFLYAGFCLFMDLSIIKFPKRGNKKTRRSKAKKRINRKKIQEEKLKVIKTLLFKR